MITKSEISTNTPRLRFPEFRDAGDWEKKALIELITLVTPPKKLQTVHYLKNGLFPIIDQSKNYICGWSDDKAALIKKPLPLIVFGDHTCILKIVDIPFIQGADGIKIFKAKSKLKTKYLYQFLLSNPIVMKSYRRHFSILKKKRILFPPKQSGEQQKIADCLSSLDDVIAAEGCKLDGLRDHKKGLMQQLFPAKNKSTPKLRFPEFQGDGAWDKKTLEDVSTFVRKKIPGNKLTLNNYVSTVNLLQEYAGIKTANKLPPTGNVTKFKKDDILISNIRPYLKKIWFSSFTGGASNDVLVIRPNVKINNKYLSFLLMTDHFIDYVMVGAKGVKMPRGDITQIKKYRLPISAPMEQQKITDCLSSLDDVIKAQNRKITALKTHKKGLMQQLFPTPDEAP